MCAALLVPGHLSLSKCGGGVCVWQEGTHEGTAFWYHEQASRELSHLSQSWPRHLGAWQGRELGVGRGPDRGGHCLSGAACPEDNAAYSSWLKEPTLSFRRNSGLGEGEVKEGPWSRKPLQCFESLRSSGVLPACSGEVRLLDGVSLVRGWGQKKHVGEEL